MTRAVRPPSPLQVHRRALLGLSYVVAVVVLLFQLITGRRAV